MRFSLQDVPKRVHRRSGTLSVTLHFLRPGEMRAEIARLIDYHEQLMGRPQRRFSIDDARACIGEYRLANCFTATLSNWYNWRSPDWQLQAGDSVLEEAGIASPVQLRLALYDFVNERYGGFLSAGDRAAALEQFAQKYQLDAQKLEYLLALDSEEEALLARTGEQAPSPGEVAALYNQWVFEAALFNASDAHFVIDCNAFLKAQSVQQAAHEPLTGVGAAIKRLCFLARKLGVYYDLAYEANSSLLHLTLYGPQEMTGAPAQYGQRLARLCRLLLGYGLRAQRTLPLAAVVKAGATVHFLQRAYHFEMDGDLLKLLPSVSDAPSVPPAADTNAVFDSSIEQSFAEAFSALARSHGADGWQLEREPEPILLTVDRGASPGLSTTQGIFIPDFALTRDQHRLYFEILGYWTPAYRERKIQKLQQLKPRQDILLAIPTEARGAFASLASDFPIVEYEGQLSATELLKVLRAHIDDFAQRLAAIDCASVQQQVLQAQWIPERQCFALLHCYSRSELARAAREIVSNVIAFTPGVGLYNTNWLEHLALSFVEWLGENGRQSVPLADALQACRARWPVLAQADDAGLEALLSLWPSIQVRRSSIFEPVVALANAPASTIEESAYQPPAPAKTVRERRTPYKKRPNPISATQEDLWG